MKPGLSAPKFRGNLTFWFVPVLFLTQQLANVLMNTCSRGLLAGICLLSLLVASLLDRNGTHYREPRLHQTSHGKPRIQSALPRMSVAVEMNHRTMVRLGLYAAQRSTGLVSQLPT